MSEFNFACSKSDRLLFSRIDEAILFYEKTGKPKFIGFLDERETYLCKRYLMHKKGVLFSFFGGFSSARRTILAIGATSLEENDFPICAVRFNFRSEDKLTHRDFLGSLMGANFKREAIGDILIYEDYAVVFVLETILSPILSEIRKIGKVGVLAIQIPFDDITYEQKYEIIKGTVSSTRLDCIVALLAKKSREQANSFISEGRVFVNYTEIAKTSFLVNEKDIITIRGMGKFILNEIDGETKKGRVNLSFFRYI